MTAKQLVMYSRSIPCPYVHIATNVLAQFDVAYQEVLIDTDEVALENVLHWTGFLSVPTLVVAEEGSVLPHTPPAQLLKGHSPKGIHRGSMITEPNRYQLIQWLAEHGFIGQGDVPQ